MPKVSIIMPSLNVADYIELAIRSVMEQSMTDIEIICIDASSNDGTWEILESLSNEDKRITLVKTSTRSYGYQVNLGIKIATGEYVAIVETDDFVNQDMYEILYEYAHSNDCDYVKADYRAYWTQKNGEKVFVNRKNPEDGSLYKKVICPKQYPRLGEDDWYLWTGIYNRNFIIGNQIRFTESKGAAFQDIGFLIKTMQYAKRAMYVDDMLYNYCIDREGASSNQKNILLYAVAEFKNSINDCRPESGDNELFYARMAKSFLCCASEMDTLSVENEECFNWFADHLKLAIEKQYLTESIIAASIWKQVMLLVHDKDKYFQERDKNKNEILEKYQEVSDRGVIIFGCGNFGYEAYKWSLNNSLNIIGFMDNNKALWNKHIDELPVYSPNCANDLQSNTVYLIANEKYSNSIRQQLNDLGISDNLLFEFK